MGICGSQVERAPFRLLLLGPGGVGKSTLFKQVKLHQAREGATKGFSEKEKSEGATAIRHMLHSTLSALTRNETMLEALSTHAQESLEELLMDIDDMEQPENQKKLLAIVKDHWRTDGVSGALKMLKKSDSHESVLQSNEWIQYWIDEADRVLTSFFSPTDDDLIKLRRPTSGVQELYFDMSVDSGAGASSVPFCIVDMGGQTHEMKTWGAELVKNIGGIIFVCSLADFNKRGLQSKNRLQESLHLLDDVMLAVPGLQMLPVVVMMNKVDLFTERMGEGVKFYKHFKKCPRVTDAQDALTWLDQELRETKNLITAPHGAMTCFPTCATDSAMAATMITNIVDALLQENLAQTGML